MYSLSLLVPLRYFCKLWLDQACAMGRTDTASALDSSAVHTEGKDKTLHDLLNNKCVSSITLILSTGRNPK